MKRREFLLNLLALAVSAPTSVFAASAPYREIGRPRLEDAKRVQAFFSFKCPACRDMHAGLARWGNTLPKAISYEFVPIVGLGDPESIISARAWYAVQSINPALAAQFAEMVYRFAQDGNQSLENRNAWITAVERSGIPRTDFIKAWTAVPADKIKRAANLLTAYEINVTPSVAIAGRYVVSPDDTNGDTALFFNLLNGMVSKSL